MVMVVQNRFGRARQREEDEEDNGGGGGISKCGHGYRLAVLRVMSESWWTRSYI